MEGMDRIEISESNSDFDSFLCYVGGLTQEEIEQEAEKDNIE